MAANFRTSGRSTRFSTDGRRLYAIPLLEPSKVGRTAGEVSVDGRVLVGRNNRFWYSLARLPNLTLPGAAALAAHESVTAEGTGFSEFLLLQHGIAAYRAHRTGAVPVLRLTVPRCLLHVRFPGAKWMESSTRSLASGSSEVGPTATLAVPGSRS